MCTQSPLNVATSAEIIDRIRDGAGVAAPGNEKTLPTFTEEQRAAHPASRRRPTLALLVGDGDLLVRLHEPVAIEDRRDIVAVRQRAADVEVEELRDEDGGAVGAQHCALQFMDVHLVRDQLAQLAPLSGSTSPSEVGGMRVCKTDEIAYVFWIRFSQRMLQLFETNG